MSNFHCSCGFAINDAGEFGDHLRAVFERPDDTGTDGRVHDEVDTGPGRPQTLICVCGFTTADADEFDDHVLLKLIPPDGIGNDGDKHVPVDPSTPERWHVPENPGE